MNYLRPNLSYVVLNLLYSAFQLLFLAKIPNTCWTKFENSSNSVQLPKANHILLMNARKMECNQEFSSNAVTHIWEWL